MTIEYPAPPTKNRALLEHVVKQRLINTNGTLRRMH